MGAQEEIQTRGFDAKRISFLWSRHVSGTLDGVLATVLPHLDFSVKGVSHFPFVLPSTYIGFLPLATERDLTHLPRPAQTFCWTCGDLPEAPFFPWKIQECGRLPAGLHYSLPTKAKGVRGARKQTWVGGGVGPWRAGHEEAQGAAGEVL